MYQLFLNTEYLGAVKSRFFFTTDLNGGFQIHKVILWLKHIKSTIIWVLPRSRTLCWRCSESHQKLWTATEYVWGKPFVKCLVKRRMYQRGQQLFSPFFILISSGTLNASQQQATSSWVNGTELILPQTPTAISTKLCMEPQLAFFQEAAKDLIVSESNFCWPQSH